MIRFLYNLVWPIGLLLFLPGYLRKMFRRGGYRRKFGQRFALYDKTVRERLKTRPHIWLHAVSVGEVAIALKLARAIVGQNPDARFALTTTTTTGFAFAEQNAPIEIEVVYSPLDFWPVMRRAFAVINPKRVILVEAEVWPNMVAFARKRRIPIALVNARLSPRSEGRFQKFKWFIAPIFGQLDLVCVPESADVQRWIALGVDPQKLRHTGSIKFDPAEDEKQAGGRKLALIPSGLTDSSRLILFGGSTHRGEEEILARIFLSLRQEFPALLLFLAPRHVERAREIKKQLEKQSLGVNLCSELDINSKALPDCLILDRTGELRDWYRIGTVVFVGKSLTAFGGQNPVEPIQAGSPVVFGLHMENFAALAHELVSNNGAIEIVTETDLAAAVADLLRKPKRRFELVEKAREVVDSHRGATSRSAELVLKL
jgi:3-deoxy-D-manno-octulosonic-acid transferase